MAVNAVIKPTPEAVWAEVSKFLDARFELDDVDRIELREIMEKFGA